MSDDILWKTEDLYESLTDSPELYATDWLCGVATSNPKPLARIKSIDLNSTSSAFKEAGKAMSRIGVNTKDAVSAMVKFNKEMDEISAPADLDLDPELQKAMREQLRKLTEEAASKVVNGIDISGISDAVTSNAGGLIEREPNEAELAAEKEKEEMENCGIWGDF